MYQQSSYCSMQHTHLKELSCQLSIDVLSGKGGVAGVPEVETGLLVLPIAGLRQFTKIVFSLQQLHI